MTGKMKLYIGLLVLGLVAVGCGIWQVVATSRPEIPEGNPVVYAKFDYIMRGEVSHLYLYRDGYVLYIAETGLRMPVGESTRTWSTDRMAQSALDGLVTYLETGGLGTLDGYYLFPGEPIEGGGFRQSDLVFTVIIDSASLQKTVTAFGYLTPDDGATYPDMPPPLDEIYERLRAVAAETKEVYRESIPR